MYTTVRGLPTDAPAPEPDGAGPSSRSGGRRRVGRVVLLLGTVSFFTDLSSEMVVAVLPVYLTLVLGLSPVQYGVVDGLYNGVSAGVRILGGVGADLTRRPKLVAVLGYGLSAVVKLLFLPAATFAAISAVVALERSGKGMRTAPRDAMIVESAPPQRLGYAFGVHRAMDTAGALGGPLIAFGLLGLLTDPYDAIFVLSFALATIGVAILVLFVPEARPAPVPEGAKALTTSAPTTRPGVRGTFREVARLTRRPAYRRLMAVGALVSLATMSDGFVYLVLRERVGVSATLFPLLFVGTAAGYLVLAVPLGRLADRIGRRVVFLSGYAVAACAYLLLCLGPADWGLVVVVLALTGAYYAATDGVLPALTAPLVPEGVRTSGIAGVQTVVAVGNLIAAVLFGALWSRFGLTAAVLTFGCALVLVVVAAFRLLRGIEDATT